MFLQIGVKWANKVAAHLILVLKHGYVPVAGELPVAPKYYGPDR